MLEALYIFFMYLHARRRCNKNHSTETRLIIRTDNYTATFIVDETNTGSLISFQTLPITCQIWVKAEFQSMKSIFMRQCNPNLTGWDNAIFRKTISSFFFRLLLLLFWEFFIPALAYGFLTGVWVTANLLKSSELFLVFWPILIILSFGWPSLVLPFLSPPVLVPILWWLYRVCQLQLVLSSFSCSIVFSVLWQGLCIYFSSLSFSFTLWSDSTDSLF